MSDRIAIGVIRRAHGVRGEASVEPWTDAADRFSELHSVTLVSPDEARSREVRIESTRVHAGRALLKFENIDTPEEIQLLHNWTIEIPDDEARELEEGEYFLHDLTGLTLVDEEGRERGVVVDVYEGGGGMLLDVKRSDGRKFEVPFAAEICTSVDLEAKTMHVKLPDGIDDLEAVEE